ncbi:hypothetical protein [Bacillus sp. NPDC077027]
MGFVFLIVLCMIVLLSAHTALKPLGKKHKVKSFQSIEDFFIDKDNS